MISSKPRDHRLDGEGEGEGQVAGHGETHRIFDIAMTALLLVVVVGSRRLGP
jgi:hypothetical protein